MEYKIVTLKGKFDNMFIIKEIYKFMEMYKDY